MPTNTFKNGTLTLEVTDADERICIRWLGRSTARNPGQFILPILTHVLEKSTTDGRPVLIDFQDAEYLNSSSITPIIRILEVAKRGTNAVTVLYKKSLKWQALSFTALEVFHTDDCRIEVRGV